MARCFSKTNYEFSRRVASLKLWLDDIALKQFGDCELSDPAQRAALLRRMGVGQAAAAWPSKIQHVLTW